MQERTHKPKHKSKSTDSSSSVVTFTRV